MTQGTSVALVDFCREVLVVSPASCVRINLTSGIKYSDTFAAIYPIETLKVCLFSKKYKILLIFDIDTNDEYVRTTET